MNLFLYLAIISIWGTTWLAIAYQVGNVPIDVSIFYRFALASALIFSWSYGRRQNLKFSWQAHGFFLAQGFFMFSMNFMAAYGASYYIPSGLNAISFSMVIVFNIINSFIFFKFPLTRSIFYGVFSGIAGLIIIFWPSIIALDLSNNTLFGIFLSLLGGLLSSFGNMISFRNQRSRIPVLESNAYAMGYGALIMLAIVYYKDLPLGVDLSYPYIFSLLHLTLLGSVVGFGCYLTLLGRVGPNKASYALIGVPLVALGISTFFENFIWDVYTFSGVSLILLGNLMARTSESRGQSQQKAPLPAFSQVQR